MQENATSPSASTPTALEELRNLEETVLRLEAHFNAVTDSQVRYDLLNHINRISAEIAHLRVSMGG
jgi:hypothetical protein